MKTGKRHGENGGKGPLGRLIMAAALVLALAGPLPAAEGLGGEAYLQGLEALSAGKWIEAQAVLGKAVEADEDNPDYLTARGVARALALHPAEAIKDLQRSLRLRNDDWETKLWLGAAFYMKGDAASASQNITHGPRGRQASKADLDYSAFVYNLGLNYWQILQGGKARVMEGRATTEMSLEELKSRQFPRAAAMFTSRRKSEAPPRLAGDLLQRAFANMRQGLYSHAVKDLDSLLAATPEDDKLLLMHAECLLALGDYSGSRREYTRVLTNQPTWAAAFGGRALAAAHMGDADRARGDLAVAAKLGAEVSARRREVEDSLAVIKSLPPTEAMIELDKGVRAGESEARLQELALAAHWAVNARRLRYDEIYQERLRALEEARQTAANNPDRLADLAQFLFDESYPPFEHIEPGSWPVYYRYVPQGVPRFGPEGQLLPAPPEKRTAREVARAKALAEEAMAINPAHFRSMGIKGKILNYEGQYENALKVLDKAVALKSDDPVLLRERSVALQALARQNMLAAGALRTPKVSRINNQDGTVTIRTEYPSEADLARADALERAAKEYHDRAVTDMTKAQRLTEGTALGAFYQGLVDYAFHNLKQAQTDFQQAVKLDPNFRDAWKQLAKVNKELGLPEEWATAQEGGLRAIQTTAGPWLTVARPKITATQFKSARAALAEARRLDPADARVTAYEAVIEAASDKNDEALVKYRTALALEYARGRLHGRNQAMPGTGAPAWDPRDIGLTLAIRNAMGALLFEAGQSERAGEMFKANLDFLAALPPEKLATPVPSSSLPSATAETSAVPTVETYAMLKVRAQAGMDFVKWVSRYKDPRDVALAASTFKRLVAQAEVNTTKPEVLEAIMSLAMAQLELSKGNNARALQLLQNTGAVPQPLWQEKRRAEAAARQGGQAAEQDRYQREQERRSQTSPAQAQRERLLSDRTAYERQRRSALDSLANPGLSARERQVLEGSVSQYDRLIQDIDRRLGR